METFDLAEAADRIGVNVDELRRLVELGIIKPDVEGRFPSGALRRAGLVDAPAFERFSALGGVTFAELAERTGVPVEPLLFVREAAGSSTPLPDDRVRDEELPFVEVIEAQVKAGFRPAAIQQQVRAQGDGLRRIAETESALWAIRDDRAGARGRQAARPDPRGRLRRSDERPG